LLKYFDHVAYQAQHLRGGPNTLLETELLKQNFYSGNSGRLQTKQNLHACSSNSIQMPGNSPKQIFSIFGLSNLVCICLTFVFKQRMEIKITTMSMDRTFVCHKMHSLFADEGNKIFVLIRLQSPVV
jgi:hypothetical protein